MRTHHGVLVVSLAISFAALGACQPAEEEEEMAPADTAAMETGAATGEAGVTPTASTSQLIVTNPMPHAMIVSVEYEGGGTTELGTVPANGEQSFTLAASPGESVTLIARDEDQTHSPRTTLVLTADNTWTIQ